MKKRIASLALATLVFAGSLSAYAASYPNDIAKSKYKDAIKYTYDNNIVTGYSDGTFRPADTITRSEFAAMVARWRKLKLDKKSDFTDAKDSWASKAIAAVAKKGWMLGTGDRKFSPEEKISYIEALTVMVRAIGKESEAEEFGGYPLGYSYTSDRYGFTEGIAGGLDSPIYRGAVSQLVYNSKDRFDAVEGGTEDSSTGLVDKLGVVKSYEFLESRNIRVQKDVDLASAIEQLPREVYVLLESGQGVLIKVKWDLNSSYNKDVAGTYSIKGKVELPNGIKDTKKKIPTSLYGTVEVVEGEPDTTGEKIVNTYAELGVKEFQTDFGDTEAEALKKLTSKTKIYLIGGGSIDADIKWTIPGYNGLQPKKHDAIGKIELPTGVVDRLGVIKDLSATLTVGEEPPNLKINLIEMISETEYKITLNKLLENLLPNTVTVVEGSGAKSISVNGIGPVDKISYGSSKKELIVKLDIPLDPSKSYVFKVSDGEGPVLEFPHSQIIKPDTNKIDKIIVGDNKVPAGENTQIKFKALNADGIDITETVRGTINVVNTNRDRLANESFNLGHDQVEFFYLEYKDKDYNEETNKVMKKTPTYRIVGENRKIVSIEDWTFVKEGENIDWSKKVQTMQIGGGSKNIYINPKDQFGDIGKVKYSTNDIIKLDDPKALRSDIASLAPNIMTDGDYYSRGPIAKIDLANPAKLGMTSLNIEIEKDGSKFKTAIPINVVSDSVPSSLYLENPTITLSSSASLPSGDKTETVVVELKDQYGVEKVPSGDIGFEIKSGSDIVNVSRVDTDKFTVEAVGGKSGTANIEFKYDGKTVAQTIVVKSPGPVSHMDYIGFKEELVKGETPEKMEIKIYQYDKDGVAVKRVEDNITAEVINKSGEEESKKDVDVSEYGTVIISSSDIDINTVNTLLIKVGGITVLEERFVVK